MCTVTRKRVEVDVQSAGKTSLANTSPPPPPTSDCPLSAHASSPPPSPSPAPQGGGSRPCHWCHPGVCVHVCAAPILLSCSAVYYQATGYVAPTCTAIMVSGSSCYATMCAIGYQGTPSGVITCNNGILTGSLTGCMSEYVHLHWHSVAAR